MNSYAVDQMQFEIAALAGEPTSLFKALSAKSKPGSGTGDPVAFLQAYLATKIPEDHLHARYLINAAVAYAAEQTGMPVSKVRDLTSDAVDEYLGEKKVDLSGERTYVEGLDHHHFPMHDKSTMEEDDQEDQGLGEYYFSVPGSAYDPWSKPVEGLSRDENRRELSEHRREWTEVCRMIAATSDPQKRSALAEIMGRITTHIRDHQQAMTARPGKARAA